MAEDYRDYGPFFDSSDEPEPTSIDEKLDALAEALAGLMEAQMILLDNQKAILDNLKTISSRIYQGSF